MENLMICENAGTCENDCISGHKTPHDRKGACFAMCGYPDRYGKETKCIPYKPEVKMFKVGDKVRLVNANGWTVECGLLLGGKYIVSEIDSDGALKVERNGHWISNGDFQLAEEAYMESPKYVAACKVIDDMTAICGDGKKEVKKLVASILGVEVKEERTYDVGDVFKKDGDYFVMSPNGKGEVMLLILGNEHALWIHEGSTGIGKNTMRTLIKNKEYEYIGHALECLKVIEK